MSFHNKKASRVRTAAEFLERVQRLKGQWAYRGVLNRWYPETSLERACRAWRENLRSAPEIEWKLTREFRRHPLGAVARSQSCLETWSLMQHHGAPTRLMDWSYSPYVALYFAYRALLQSRGERQRRGRRTSLPRASIWAIDVEWVKQAIETSFADKPELLEALHGEKDDPGSFCRLVTCRATRPLLITTGTPLAMNERLSVQQGVFLLPGDVSRSWMDNLRALGWSERSGHSHDFVIQSRDVRGVFDLLIRTNVTARSLFPGLDGYAESLWHRLKLLKGLPVPRDHYGIF